MTGERITYADAGVDIHAGDKAVELMKAAVARTHGPEVLGGVGAFAGLFDASALLGYRRPLLASSTDGVGTKIVIARTLGVHDTIGQDLVAMVVDDIVVCGHTGCGGIQALAGPTPPDVEPHLGRWVEYTRPAHDLVRAARVPEDEAIGATIKAHIQFQLDNLMTYDLVATGVAEGRIAVHGWLYDMEKGEIQAYDPKSGSWRGLLELAEGGAG